MRGLGHEPGLAGHELGELPTGQARPEVAQLAKRSGVEGAHGDALDAQVVQAGAHLAGGARGEGDCQGAAWIMAPGVHAVGDAMGDGTGLAGAGAGQDRHRTVERLRGCALLVVEPIQRVRAVEEIHGADAATPP